MLVEKIYKVYDREDKPRDRTYFYVSEADKCPRAVFYSFKKMPKAKLGPEVYLRFEEGDDTHKRLVKAFLKSGILVATEINTPRNDLFSGRADAVVNIDKELYVVEIKSVGSYKFKLSTEPSIEHVKQLQLYLYFFNIDRGIILLQNKDNQQLKEFIIEKDMGLINQILADFKKLKTEIENDALPEIPKDLAGWKCNWCPYNKVCKKNNMF